MRFDAVAFDLDGTLYPSLSLYIHALPIMLGKLRELGAFNYTRRQLRASASREGIESTCLAFRARENDLFAERMGIAVPEAAAMIERDFYRGVEELFSRIKPFRGLKTALDTIAASGLRLGLLSDLPPHRKLELLGLSGRFDPALCSEDSGFLKPAEEPFEMLASRLGLRRDRILYVGNSPSIDVAGAKRAGMSAAIISLRRVEGADLSFFSWRRLAEFATS
jgi:putative hydrolase of the HAD superfamily